MPVDVKLEYAEHRPIRARNTIRYRFYHWPIWITVFFLLPGPLIFKLFSGGWSPEMGLWLGAVLIGTGICGVLGNLPGVEPVPYILRFTEDRPNPIYRRVCYTAAWSELIAYQLLNLIGLIVAVATGQWQLKQIYDFGYFPIVIAVWILGALGVMPRVKPSTKGEGTERRYFYGMVWSAAAAQPVLLILWKTMPVGFWPDLLKLGIYIGILILMGLLARKGVLLRTRKIVSAEWAVSD